MHAPRGRLRRGFTLIEMLAVVAIFALLAGITLPNFNLRAGRAADDEARRLAAGIEYARARTVATGVPHRVVLDLEGHGYWIEWRAADAAQEEPLDVYRRPPGGPIAMAPPRQAQADFALVPSREGAPIWLPGEVAFVGVESAGSFVQRGLVALLFERDGTAEPASIALAETGGPVLWLELAALSDTVRVVHGGR
jgi:type II secretion system protein H